MLTQNEFDYLWMNMNPLVRNEINNVLPYISKDLFTILYTDWDPSFESILDERGIETEELEYELCGEEYDMCEQLRPELYDSFKDFIESFEPDDEVFEELEWIL